MKLLTRKIEEVLSPLPNHIKAPYIEKVKKYSNECGCSLGAKFLVMAIIVSAIYLGKFAALNLSTLPKQILYGLAFIFICSVTGKMAGIGIARFRLFKLYRSLRTKFYNTKNNAYVHMHQMG